MERVIAMVAPNYTQNICMMLPEARCKMSTTKVDILVTRASVRVTTDHTCYSWVSINTFYSDPA